MSRKGAQSKTKVSWCDGWGANPGRHPTSRKLVRRTGWKGTTEETTLMLCPDCAKDFDHGKSVAS